MLEVGDRVEHRSRSGGRGTGDVTDIKSDGTVVVTFDYQNPVTKRRQVGIYPPKWFSDASATLVKMEERDG
jgi:uncharacterized protein YodC (DUF2158 family)